MKSSKQRKKEYQAAVDRTMKWVLAHQQPDGGFGEITSMSHYMALGASLHFTGYDESAKRSMPFIKKTYITKDGDFVPPVKESSLLEHYYAPSWIIYSAQVCAATDIAQGGMPHVLKVQDAKTGGLFGSLPDAEKGEGIIHPAATSLGGLAAWSTGNLAQAKRLGDHLVDNLIPGNPDLSKAFYPTWHTEHGVMTGADVPVSTNSARVLVRNEAGQYHFLTGMMIALLSKLYESSKDRKYLDGALTLYEFAAGGTPAVFANTLSHKFIWGCDWLYQQTGQAEHLESACRLCDYLVGIQEPDGTFTHLGLGVTPADWPYSPRMGISSQFALWIRLTADLL